MYNRSDHAGFDIDDARRTARGGPCRCTWEPSSAAPDDDKCTRTAKARLGNSKPAGTGRVAGFDTVQYRSIDEGGTEDELSLAPALACEVMEEVHTWPGTFGIPGAKWRYTVNSYQAGEPDPKLFRVPDGYKVEPGRR